MTEKQIASITLKVDVSEALTGLKALTREARKATAALAELREAMKEEGTSCHIGIGTISCADADEKSLREVADKIAEKRKRSGKTRGLL